MIDYLDFVKRVLRMIDAEIEVVDSGLLTGIHLDHAATRQAIGKRQGLVSTRAIITKSITAEDHHDLRF